MARSEAPASAKAAGNGYPHPPTATAPVVDSTLGLESSGLYLLGGTAGQSPPAVTEMAPSAGSEDGARRTGPALEAMYRFALWLVPAVEKFPRHQKFLLGDRIQATALDVLERLIEATYTRDRRGHLYAANLGIEKLRLLCRLAKDLGHLDERR